jgi:cell filamentation protein
VPKFVRPIERLKAVRHLSDYDVFEDPYCYEGMSVLKNKAGIRDTKRLESFELEMSNSRAHEPLPAGRFTPAHYCKIHHHLFRDVYTWAGKPRTVRTAKGGNPFCFPEYIDREMRKLFATLRAPDFQLGVEREAFVSAAAKFLAELNAIHPFREGNGRSQLAFLHLLGLRAGHTFDLERINRETFLPAMIASYHGHLGPLVAELRKLLT